MQRAIGIIVNLLLLAATAQGAAIRATAFLDSAETYRSPLRGASLLTDTAGEPLVERVALVTIHGFTGDMVRTFELPVLERLIDAGASAPIAKSLPAGPVMTWATLLSGAGPGLNDASPFYQELPAARPLLVDNLLAAARDQERHLGLAGMRGWENMFPADYFSSTAFANGEDAVTDDAVIVGAALSMLRNDDLQLVLIELNQVNAALQRYGVDSPEVEAAAQQVDAHLDLIARRLDLDRAILIVVLETGELASASQLYVMIGRRVIPGRYSDIQQTDLAPTLSVLLGARLPTASQGRPALEMLRIDESARARFNLALAAQQFALTQAYLSAIGQTPSLTTQRRDLTTAQASLESGNFSGATRLAELLVADLKGQVSLAQTTRLAEERRWRAVLASTALALGLVLLWYQRQQHWQLGLVTALLTVVTYYGLYRFQHGYYVFGLIGDLPAFAGEIRSQVMLAMTVGATGLTLLLSLRRDLRFWKAVAIGYSFAGLATLGLAIPAIYAYWQTGWRITWYLPDGRLLFWQLSGLQQTTTAAMVGLGLPWLIGILVWSANIIRKFAPPSIQGRNSFRPFRAAKQRRASVPFSTLDEDSERSEK